MTTKNVRRRGRRTLILKRFDEGIMYPKTTKTTKETVEFPLEVLFFFFRSLGVEADKDIFVPVIGKRKVSLVGEVCLRARRQKF